MTPNKRTKMGKNNVKCRCTTLFDKDKKTESVLVKALAGSALKNPNMMVTFTIKNIINICIVVIIIVITIIVILIVHQTFLGENRISQLTDYESLSEKYGAKVNPLIAKTI